ncbi:MAG: gliding motility-associated C-terminal domain-containing protein [Cytophagaceae bacterium]
MNRTITSGFVSALILCFVSLYSMAQVCPIAPATNLVTNGNFESGCAGIGSDYQYNGNCDAGSLLPSQWTVTSNAQARNGYYRTPQTQIPGEPAPGVNQFMIVDADDVVGKDAWRTTVNVTSGVTYYFSAWFSNLHESFDNPPRLRFSINNVQQGVVIATPNNTHDWKQFYTVWTANITGTITIRIENIALGAQGNDLGLDGISFSTSCGDVKDPSLIGEDSKLPSVISICDNGGSVTLDPQLPSTGYTYQWKKDPDLNTVLSTSATYTTSTPGRYYLCYEYYVGCPRTDTVDVVTSFNLDLGPDINLCSPNIATIRSGMLVPPATIKWYKDNVLLPYEVSADLTVNEPGTYKIEVSAPNCGTVTDEVIVTSSGAVPINATYCTVPASLTLRVSPANSGKYKWWNDPTSTDPSNLVQRGGDSYTFTATANGGYTFYVEDTASFAGTVGPATTFSSGGTGYDKADLFTVISVNTSVTITSLKVDLRSYYNGSAQTANISFALYQSDKTTLITTINADPLNLASGYANGLYTLNFTNTPFTITPAMGSQVYIKVIKGGSFNGYIESYTGSGANPAYPYNATPSNAMQIIGAVDGGALQTNIYGRMFDIQFMAGSGCDRIPVRAIDDCPPIVCSAVAPTSATADSTLICEGTVTDIELTAVGGSGDNVAWYTGLCGGTKVGDGAMLTVPAPTVTTTYYARWETTTCNSSCASVTVTVTPKIIALVTDTIKLCNDLSTPIVGNNPAPGTAQWSVYQGTLSVNDVNAVSTEAFNIEKGISKVVYTINVGFCTSTDTITIVRDTMQTFSVISGPSLDTCANTGNLVYDAIPDFSTARDYTWEVTGTVTASPMTGVSTTVNNGANGGKLILVQTSGSCLHRDTLTLTISAPIAAPNAGPDQSICIDQTTMAATAITVGSGEWTVKSGSGTITNPTSPTTTITGLGQGTNEFTWTVNGCGGPLSEDVIVEVGTSAISVSITVPSDTLCFNTARTLVAVVTGGSGNYEFVWNASDNSMVNVKTSTGTITVNPNSKEIIYTVVVNDLTNVGCSSNVATGTLHAVSKQKLEFNNLLTPGGDGLNDRFIAMDKLNNLKLLPGSTLEVYNRWGDRVFTSENYNNQWTPDNVSDGVYYYHFKSGCGGDSYKGWIHIVNEK